MVIDWVVHIAFIFRLLLQMYNKKANLENSRFAFNIF
uniref:Uncharacterized protein n=1 Tax=Myoviridae sp. ctn8H20 TaxID=2825169 RepID=A0A8S5QGQ6_9CAUD|nr:MAG TPA: hypothetical protein [Myoviridae sp. ctn8H20]